MHLEELEYQSNVTKMKTYMDSFLTQQEKEILVLRYGLGKNRELTQSEVGEIYGISRSYVSRIEKKALQKLKKCFESDK